RTSIGDQRVCRGVLRRTNAPNLPILSDRSMLGERAEMRVLITGASTIFAPPLIQGFGARGIEVTAADSRWFSTGKASRHTARRVRVPRISRDPAGFLRVLLGEVRSRSYDLVLPAFEESLLLAEYRHVFEPFTRLLLPPFETMWQVHDKRNLY